jgi:aspartate aminotransferase
MAYTPGMIVADAVAANLAKASWIRRTFEEGARLKQERGAEKVFDFRGAWPGKMTPE